MIQPIYYTEIVSREKFFQKSKPSLSFHFAQIQALFWFLYEKIQKCFIKYDASDRIDITE